MGFVCNLLLSGALTASYNINSGAAAPERICRGVALTNAAESPVGTKLDFRLSADDATVEGKGGSMERLPDNDKGIHQVRQTLQEGGSMDRSVAPEALTMLKQQVAKDTTLGMTR